MMRITRFASAVAFILAGAALAQAQDAAPPIDTPPKSTVRYSFDRAGDVFLRLDTASGQVSVCSLHSAGWVCQVVPEDRTALENEIGRLQSDVAALKAEIATLREPPPPRPPADLAPPAKATKPAEVTIKMPTQEDIGRARDAVAHAWQRLVEMIVGLKNDVMRKG